MAVNKSKKVSRCMDDRHKRYLAIGAGRLDDGPRKRWGSGGYKAPGSRKRCNK